jgi:replication-associated recombination protein RarA
MSEMTASEQWSEKYRPRTLDQVVGQHGPIAQIKGMIKRKCVDTTMLITGETGHGKTSLALLIAYAINGIKYGTKSPDIQDFNIGADGGKEDVLKIIQFANYKPHANFRVIILDEMHRLSTAAASALLKPLEKPPANTVWILATNEPQKLLPTIVGRATKFVLETPTVDELVVRLKQICDKESANFITDKYLKRIAESCNMQPRSSIGMLQSMVNMYHGGEKDLKSAFNAAMSAQGKTLEYNAAKALVGVYTKKPKSIYNAVKDVKQGDYIGFATYLLFHNAFLMEDLMGVSTWNNDLRKAMKDQIGKQSFTKMILVNEILVEIKRDLFGFNVPEAALISTKLMKLTVGDK